MIYLDNCATTYPKPEEVYRALDQANRNLSFNSGRGEHQFSIQAADAIENVRTKLAGIVRQESSQVIFSPSATQALNQIIFGLEFNEGDTVYVSPFEHNSIVRPLKSIDGLRIEMIPFDPETWSLDEKELGRMFLAYPPKAVFVSEVSNVTGYRLPWEKIFSLSRSTDAVNILDASQSFRPGNQYDRSCDFIVFNGHKSLVGAMGTGGFINMNRITLRPFILGGTGSDSLSAMMPVSGPLRYEAGTQNTAAIASLDASIDWLKQHDQNRKEELGDNLAHSLQQIPGVVVYKPEKISTHGIVSFNLEGYQSSETAAILNTDFGIAVRGGYHCSPLVHSFIQSEKFGGTVRVSIGYFNTQEDIDAVVAAMTELSEEEGL